MNALLTFNILLDTETQLKAAASPRRLCSGQRQRYSSCDHLPSTAEA